MQTITTESGSVYEWDQDGQCVRRVQADTGLRRDGEWLDLLWCSRPEVGRPWQMELIGLADGAVTVRTTTHVVAVL